MCPDKAEVKKSRALVMSLQPDTPENIWLLEFANKLPVANESEIPVKISAQEAKRAELANSEDKVRTRLLSQHRIAPCILICTNRRRSTSLARA